MAEVKKKKQSSTVAPTSSLMDIIAPSVLDFKPKHIQVGDVFQRVLVITAYPSSIGSAWLSRIVSMPGVNVSLHAEPTDPTRLIDDIRISMGEAEARMHDGNNITKERAEKQFEDNKLLLKKIDQQQQKVFNVVIVIVVTASNLDQLDVRVRNVEQRLSGMGMRGRAPVFKQKQAYLSAGPWAILDPEIFAFGARNMPAESVAGAYPFVYAGLNDGDGVMLGRDDSGGILIIDIWMREGSRTNSNMTILGRPGVGKSTTIKKWLKEEFGRGCKLIIIDPEDEYSGLAEGCRGTVIDVGNGTKSRINPLQVRSKVPLDEEGEEDTFYTEEELQKGPLALHFSFLRTFFKLYLKETKEDRDYTRKHQSCLEMALEETYRRKNITWDTDPTKIKNDEWPIMENLHEVICEYAKGDKYKQYWEDLELLLYPAAKGADKHLWNGPSTLQAENEVVVLNIQSLLEADESIKRSQIFNILSWAWSEIDEDWEERIILAVDETYLLADPEIPQALMFLRNTSKRIRKREGALWVITHNMIDFMDPAIRRFGQALLDNPAYKFIMGQGENDIEALTNLMHLSEKEREMLEMAKRGEGLLIAGNKRLHIKVKVTPEDEKFIGTAGGR